MPPIATVGASFLSFDPFRKKVLPMVITSTLSISFFGGGTVTPPGVGNTAPRVGDFINKYCYITCRRLPPFLSTTAGFPTKLKMYVETCDRAPISARVS
jgi:hypothetical protein